MEEQSVGGGGEPPNLSPSDADAGEDRLSALPNDILFLILLRLRSITEAAQTSVLSRRWRRIWTLLPELTFFLAPDDRRIREVLAANEAPVLRRISVFTKDDAPDSAASWLPLAADRITGFLIYTNYNTAAEDENEVQGSIPLPCFSNATVIKLHLGRLTLAMPSSGVFTRLTELSLERVRFGGTSDLGDVVSSSRCPCLRKLSLCDTQGLTSLSVFSESLLEMDLHCLNGLLQLKIVASALEELTVHKSFVPNQPIADISAPQLESLHWRDAYDPSSVDFGNLGQLKRLSTCFFLVYGQHGVGHNRDFQWLLQRFQFIHSLTIPLIYAKEIYNQQYFMEDMKVLPNVVVLTMLVINEGHSFGASLFHVLKLCTGIQKLSMFLHTASDLEVQSICPSGCFCDQPPNWKTEELSLSCLQEVEITGLRGAEHEVIFVKQLFNWAAVLKDISITFEHSISESKVEELCQRLSCFCRPETHLQFYETELV